MWNFIKGLFKFVFSLLAITTVVVGVGVVAFAYIFKKDFEAVSYTHLTLPTSDLV